VGPLLSIEQAPRPMTRGLLLVTLALGLSCCSTSPPAVRSPLERPSETAGVTLMSRGEAPTSEPALELADRATTECMKVVRAKVPGMQPTAFDRRRDDEIILYSTSSQQVAISVLGRLPDGGTRCDLYYLGSKVEMDDEWLATTEWVAFHEGWIVAGRFQPPVSAVRIVVDGAQLEPAVAGNIFLASWPNATREVVVEGLDSVGSIVDLEQYDQTELPGG